MDANFENNTTKYKHLKILITGYGPFMNISNNPSQILVEHIKENIHNLLKDLNNVDLINHEIFEVSCDYVCKNLNKIHDNINDQEFLFLIVHFGVNSSSKVIQLESQSKNFICDFVKYKGCIEENGKETYKCKLNLNEIHEELKGLGHNVEVSQDAGYYLCNYIYYKSCHKFEQFDNVIPIFIHIPEINNANTEQCFQLFCDFIKIVNNKKLK